MVDDLSKVLIVDNDMEVSKFISNGIQKKTSCETVVCHNGDVAVDLYLKHLPDVTIIDAMLPGKTGFQFLERVKRLRGRKIG